MPDWYDALPERDLSLSSRWQTEEFRDELRDLVRGDVGPVTQMEQHKLRGWATVWRVTTAEAAWFAKQNCPGQLFEQPLMSTLARLAPDRVVPVRAEGEGFLLTPDQGPVFYETAGSRPGELGTAGARRSAAPARAGPASRGTRRSRGDRAAPAGGRTTTSPPASSSTPGCTRTTRRRLAPDVADRLRAHLPVVRRWAEQVAALDLPLTLNHNDLHENNVFDVDGRLLFFDFGDALVTEPLGVLLIPLNILGEKLQADGDDPPPVAGRRRGPRGLERPRPSARAPPCAARRAPARPAGPASSRG